MKNVTIMMAALCSPFVVAATPVLAHQSGDVPLPTTIVSDLPLAAPRWQMTAVTSSSIDGRQMSGSNYFYAPGSGPRCEIRMKRIQGRIYQTCE